MKLSILIPTYNRAPFLLKNLDVLNGFIIKSGLCKDIEVIVSNNFSNDETDKIVRLFQRRNQQLNLKYYLQSENIGLEKNSLFVLNKALGEYVMFLGDDDFIEYDYLVSSFKLLESSNTISCIIPSFLAIDMKGVQIGKGRDTEVKSKKFKKGFTNCLENSWRGHQMSGLIFRRPGLFEKYNYFNVGNIYPFVFFTALSCLNGDCFHLTDYPVRVSQPGQEKKDWTYGSDGLFNEVFDNYKKLPLNRFKKVQLQIRFFRKQGIRFWQYKKQGTIVFFRVFLNIWFTTNGTFGFKILFPFMVLSQIILRIFKKLNS